MDHAQTYATYLAGPDYVPTLVNADSLTNVEIATLENARSLESWSHPDGGAVVSLRGDLLTVDDVETLLAKLHSNDVERAAAHLTARVYGDVAAYVDDATGLVYLVTDLDLALLGRMLASNVDNALRRWTDLTEAVEVDPVAVARELTTPVDLDALRSEAARDGDLVLLACVDLLPHALRAVMEH